MSLPLPARVTRSPLSAPSEQQLVDDVVRRAQQGDVSAFEQIHRAHSPTVAALCRRMANDDRAARDLVQDVFVRAWEQLPTFRGQSALSTWLHRVAVNVVLEYLRTRSRESLRLIATDDEALALAARDVSVDERLDLDAAIARLPGGARTVLLLHDVEGYSHDEISRMTGMAPGTARAQLWRARRALMRMLKT